MARFSRTIRNFVAAAALLAAAIPAFSAANQDASTTRASRLSFAWLSDTHIVTTDTLTTRGAPTLRLQHALKMVAARSDASFIVLSGDLTEDPDTAQVAAFREIMRPTLPWYPVPGNHDIGNTVTLQAVEKWLAAGFGRGAENREYYGFTQGNAAFFVLNAFPAQPTDSGMVAREEEQLRALDAFFTRHSDMSLKIVFAHPPLFIRSAGEPDEYFNVRQPLRGNLVRILWRHGVKTWLSGHRHLMDKVTDPETGITVYSQPSLAFAIGKGSRMGFCMFHLTRDGIEREFIPVDAAPAGTP